MFFRSGNLLIFWRHGFKELVHCSSISRDLRGFSRYEIQFHVVMGSRLDTSLNVFIAFSVTIDGR